MGKGGGKTRKGVEWFGVEWKRIGGGVGDQERDGGGVGEEKRDGREVGRMGREWSGERRKGIRVRGGE